MKSNHVVALSLLLAVASVGATAQDAVTGESIQVHATFTNVGVMVTISGDDNGNATASLEVDVGGAAEQDRFWQFHDIAFETKGKISRAVVQDMAADIGLDLKAFNSCLDSGRGLKVVKEDIAAGIKAGIRGTPTLFVNGRRLGGVPKPWMLNEILQFGEKNLSRIE